MKNINRTKNFSIYKVINLYLITSICTLALMFFIAGYVSIDSSAEKITGSEHSATLALSHNEEKIDISINKKKTATINLLPSKKLDFILGSNPVYWFFKSLSEIND